MKRKLQILFIFSLCTISMALSVVGQGEKKLTAKQEKREVREARRAAKQEAYEKSIDSMVMSRTFQFNPQTMQQQPAGSMNLLNNPNFNVGYWNGTIDLFLPYIKGYVPPYHSVILNYTLSSVENYTIEQTNNGWIVTFTSSMFSGSAYTFTLEISSRFGSATLTIKNPWYPAVQYSGSIGRLY